MNVIIRWTRPVVAVLAMTAAPALIALGMATASQAETAVANNGPSISHPAFPDQHNFPKPGTAEHHRHQWNHVK
jgi:hypothetical protein